MWGIHSPLQSDLNTDLGQKGYRAREMQSLTSKSWPAAMTLVLQGTGLALPVEHEQFYKKTTSDKATLTAMDQDGNQTTLSSVGIDKIMNIVQTIK